MTTQNRTQKELVMKTKVNNNNNDKEVIMTTPNRTQKELKMKTKVNNDKEVIMTTPNRTQNELVMKTKVNNDKEVIMTTQNRTQKELVMKKLIREIEKRYKVTFGNGGSERDEITIIVCRDLNETPEIDYGFPDCVSFKWLDTPFGLITEYPRNEYYRSVKRKDINRLGDIYKLTNSGDYTLREYRKFSPKSFNLLHPYIQLIRGKHLRCFRLDNPMIREMFFDTQGLVLENLDLHPKGLTKGLNKKDMETFFDFRLKEHMEYLDWIFDGRGGEWISIYNDKRTNHPDGYNMLHKDYLENSNLVGVQ